jgi:hypothetical protein
MAIRLSLLLPLALIGTLALTVATGCGSLRTLTADTMPQPGWTAAQVTATMGPSIQTTIGMQPAVEIWHYGVGTTTGMGFGSLLVLPRCDHLSSSCLSVFLRNGIVQDVRVRTY